MKWLVSFAMSKAGMAIIGAVLAIGIIGYAYHLGDSNGAARIERKQVEQIARQKAAVERDVDRLRRLTPDQLDEELKRLCREQGGSVEQCG